jgi:glycerol uptake facilitator-like aquaporin
MSDTSLARRLTAEGLGTAFLLAIVVGSGIMGERLASGNDAIALLANTMATGAGLVALISVFGPLSGAHFNPVVSLWFFLRREASLSVTMGYIVVQVIGGVLGVWAAHVMFDLPVVQTSHKLRDGFSLMFAEGVATFGLLMIIAGGLRFKTAVPVLVGLYITAAYWFTASTSFANPAVTFARSLSDTFAGIAPASAPGFILAQLIGGLAAFVVCGWLFHEARQTRDTLSPP